ncbi:MAG TPA: hypothetical protein PKD12_08780 [Nitrospira sp.]|nr:hypothetical protein [Nitrospira sp.]
MLCVMLVGMFNVSIAVAAYGTYGPIVSQHVGIRPEKRLVEEALLNFSMAVVGESIEQAGCVVGKNGDRDQRFLDPQLPASDKQNHWGPAKFTSRPNNELSVPMK